MTIYYSASSGGFYDSALKDRYESNNGWPSDAIEITEDEYERLISSQEQGKVITADKSGKPVLTDPVIDWQARAERQRQSLITAASETMTPWEREANAGILDDDDKASLIEWTKYAKALRKLNLSSVSDEAGYSAISWPVEPTA